jgi:hypothetical protein
MSGKIGTTSYVNRSDEIAVERKKKGGVSGGRNAKRRRGKGSKR